MSSKAHEKWYYNIIYNITNKYLYYNIIYNITNKYKKYDINNCSVYNNYFENNKS